MVNDSKPFTTEEEYAIFKYKYCEICMRQVVMKSGHIASVIDGGCPIEEKIERAKTNSKWFPSNEVVELTTKDGEIIASHYCKRFLAVNSAIMGKHIDMYKLAEGKKG